MVGKDRFISRLNQADEQLVRNEYHRAIPNRGGGSEKPFYELASSRYPQITIRLDGEIWLGKKIVIEAPNASKENKYIQSVTLNRKAVDGFRIPQDLPKHRMRLTSLSCSADYLLSPVWTSLSAYHLVSFCLPALL